MLFDTVTHYRTDIPKYDGVGVGNSKLRVEKPQESLDSNNLYKVESPPSHWHLNRKRVLQKEGKYISHMQAFSGVLDCS